MHLTKPAHPTGTATKRSERLRALTREWQWELDENFRFIWISDNLEELTHVKAKDILGKHPWDLNSAPVSAADWSAHQSGLSRHLPFNDFESHFLDRNGELFASTSSGTPVFDADGLFSGYLGVSRDVSEQKRSEIALKLSEGRLQLALDIAGIGVWEWDMVSDEVVWDDRQFVLFDAPKVQGKVPLATATNRIHPDDREALAKKASLVFEGAVKAADEFRIVCSDGSVRWLLGTSDIVRAGIGDQTAMLVGVNMDITAQKEAEIELRKSEQALKDANLKLEERISLSTEKLRNEAKEHAKTHASLAKVQRLDAIGQLSGGIAHDFNNLLAIVLGNAELLKQEIASSKNAAKHIDEIENSVARGAALTHRLLAFAQQRQMKPEITDVAKLVSGLKEMLQRTLTPAINLQIQTTVLDACVIVDHYQLEDALVNLVINARDSMPKGGVCTIEISETESVADDFNGRDPQGLLRVSVTDTGIGIPNDELSKVVEPFFTTKEFGKGSGLGLSMVHGFIIQSNGFFNIKSEYGNGTQITLHFPKATVTNTIRPSSVPRAYVWPKAMHILVVEDEPSLLRICATALQKQGAKVLEACDGNEALVHLKNAQKIDLLFTDIILPGDLNGVQVASIAKDMHPNLKIIYTTGYTNASGDNGIVLDPDIPCITKPYRLAELLEIVGEAFDDHIST